MPFVVGCRTMSAIGVIAGSMLGACGGVIDWLALARSKKLKAQWDAKVANPLQAQSVFASRQSRPRIGCI